MFSADPFEYEFMYAPMGDGSVYEYVELWYGFAVKKESGAQEISALYGPSGRAEHACFYQGRSLCC